MLPYLRAAALAEQAGEGKSMECSEERHGTAPALLINTAGIKQKLNSALP